MIDKNKEIKFEDVIEVVKCTFLEKGEQAVDKDNNWCVYAVSDTIELETSCYIGDYPEIDDETYEETYPEFIIDKGLKFVYSDELIQDAIISAMRQNDKLSNLDLLDAIKFYNDNDCFKKF